MKKVQNKEASILAATMALSLVAAPSVMASDAGLGYESTFAPQIEDYPSAQELLQTNNEEMSSFSSSLMESVAISGADVDKVVVSSDMNGRGHLSELLINTKSSDPAEQERIYAAAIDTLREFGLDTKADELEKIANNPIDPYAGNVLYKDGGWFVNWMPTDPMDLELGNPKLENLSKRISTPVATNRF